MSSAVETIESAEMTMFTQLSVERVSILLLAIAGIIATALGAYAFALTSVGAGLVAVLNFYFLRHMVMAMLHGGRAGVQIFLGMLLIMKFAVLGALAYLSLQIFNLNPIAILTGLSLVVLGIFCEALRSSGALNKNLAAE